MAMLLQAVAMAAFWAAQGGTMTADQVANHVKQKDWTILDQKGIVGPDAGPALLPLLDDRDPQVRELAVTCLNAAGGPAAREGLLKALHDRTETVRAVAARYLRDHYKPEDLAAIQRELTASKDEFVREQLALLLGASGDKTSVAALQKQSHTDPDGAARQSAMLALTRLGDAAARQQYIGLLHQDDPKGRVGALRDLPYLSDRSLLAEARPLLDDTRPGWNAGPSHGPYMIRVCDVAVNMIDETLGHPFPFVNPVKRYSEEEIARVKQAIP